MIEKIKTAYWFAQRPSHWRHAVALAYRKMLPDYDAPNLRAQATAWARDHAVTSMEAFGRLGIEGEVIGMDASIIEEGSGRAAQSSVVMGGPGDLELLFASVQLTRARRVIETGVAYGWSTLAILEAMARNGNGKLVSVDMPYPKRKNEDFVGIVVPERLRDCWTLIREPDRVGLKKAISIFEGQIDLCHYDSDKCWWGRAYAYPLLWDALKPGGLFISDDIQDNFFFAEFVKSKGLPFAVTEADGKFVGLILKA